MNHSNTEEEALVPHPYRPGWWLDQETGEIFPPDHIWDGENPPEAVREPG